MHSCNATLYYHLHISDTSTFWGITIVVEIQVFSVSVKAIYKT